MNRKVSLTVGVVLTVISLALAVPASGQDETGYLEICKVGLDAGTLGRDFSFALGAQTFTVRAGTAQNPFCTAAIPLTPGTNVTVTEAAQSGVRLVECHTLPENRLVSFDGATRSATVRIVSGGIAQMTILICSNTSVLAAQMQSFSATSYGRAVVLRWRTGSEFAALGFNVYRQARGAKRVKLNRSLIPAAGLTGGAASSSEYSFRTKLPARAAAARYFLQEVDADGARTWYGPVRAVAGT
jgi:hypothetical protein